jgi:hypothetical protein
MIIQTTKEITGVVYDYTYSDLGMKIMRDGVAYDEAVDPLGSNRQYTETDDPIQADLIYSDSENVYRTTY